jgi:hypothetical protein
MGQSPNRPEEFALWKKWDQPKGTCSFPKRPLLKTFIEDLPFDNALGKGHCDIKWQFYTPTT